MARSKTSRLFSVLLCCVVQALAVETWETPQGTSVVYQYDAEAPLIDLVLAWPVGSKHDEIEGQAYLTAEVALLGGGDYSEESFYDTLAANGVELSVDVDQDHLNRPNTLQANPFCKTTLSFQDDDLPLDRAPMTTLESHAHKCRTPL